MNTQVLLIPQPTSPQVHCPGSSLLMGWWEPVTMRGSAATTSFGDGIKWGDPQWIHQCFFSRLENQEKSRKILKIIERFPRWLVKWIYTKWSVGIFRKFPKIIKKIDGKLPKKEKAYIIKKWYMLRKSGKIRKNSKNY